MLAKQMHFPHLRLGHSARVRQSNFPFDPFDYPRQRPGKPLQQPVEAPPGVAPPLASPVPPFEQAAAGFTAAAPQALAVSYQSIVVPMPPVLLRDGFHQLADFLVPFRWYPCGEPSHRSPQFLAAGAALDDGVARRPAFPPLEFKSQEVKPSVGPAPAPAKTHCLRFVPGPFFLSLNRPARLAPVVGAAGLIRASQVSVCSLLRGPRSATPAGLRQPHHWRLPLCWVPRMRPRPHRRAELFRG